MKIKFQGELLFKNDLGSIKTSVYSTEFEVLQALEMLKKEFCQFGIKKEKIIYIK